MEGKLTPKQQLRVLTRIWGNREGYVFLPWIKGGAKDKASRRNSYHEGKAFRWPGDKKGILQHLQDRENDDLYFSANVFKGKRRVEELVLPERTLYADLDPVDPRQLPDPPTIAWETSPGRYQAVWVIGEEKAGASKASRENHRLSSAIGADPSGWDTTQLLRVPGRPNFKYVYSAEDQGVEGGLLWTSGPRYTWEDFEDLPQVGSVAESITEDMDEEVISQVDKHEVWSRIKLKLPHRVRELYLSRATGDMDRSDVLWDLARSFADAGCTSLEIVTLIRATVWNKFAGRSDELHRLMVTAQRAMKEKEPLVIEEETKPSSITWLADLVKKPIPRPSWLVKDIWTHGSCGFISGAPKSYKSWMAIDLAVSVATGSPFLNQEAYRVPRPQPVLYIQEEDDIRLVLDRLQNIVEGKVPDRFWGGQVTIEEEQLVWYGPTAPIPMGVQVQTGFIASDPAWHSWLDEVLEDHKFGLVIIDTLGTTAGDVDTDSSGELMNSILKPLKVLAQKHNTAVCIVHHNKKAAGLGRAGNDMLGSVALHAWVDCAIYARSKDVDGVVAIEREAKLAPELSFRLQIPFMHNEDERQLWDPMVVLPGVGDEQPPSPQPPHSFVRKLKFMGKGATLQHISEVLDEDPSKVLEVLLKAQKQGQVQESNGKWTVV